MTLDILEGITTWEAVASVQIAQAVGCDKYSVLRPTEATDLLALGGLTRSEGEYTIHTGDIALDYAKAYRDLSLQEEDIPYTTVLASVSGIKPAIQAPKFAISDIEAAGSGRSIVVAPFALNRDLDLPLSTWISIISHLRSYGLPVKLIGDKGQWLDPAGFEENDILSELPVEDKLCHLANASLVVGVPNAWTWAATAFRPAIAYFYPDNMPQHRWFGFSDERYGRMVFDPRNVQSPIVISGLRAMIASL